MHSNFISLQFCEYDYDKLKLKTLPTIQKASESNLFFPFCVLLFTLILAYHMVPSWVSLLVEISIKIHRLPEEHTC